MLKRARVTPKDHSDDTFRTLLGFLVIYKKKHEPIKSNKKGTGLLRKKSIQVCGKGSKPDSCNNTEP